MRYYLIAGEASGDLHASNLIRGLRAEDPEAVFRFRGGDMMLEAVGPCDESPLAQHYRDGAVMGVSDVLLRAGALARSLRDCERDILAWRPDAVILVDYPGFNLSIARYLYRLRRRSLAAGSQNANALPSSDLSPAWAPKVFYYIAPKTWASRARRNRVLRKYIDGLFVVFPFEREYFERVGVPYVYCGNPLVDAVDSHRYERICDEPYIALLPGSRKGEISRMMPVCMEVARALGRKVLIAGAPARTPADYQRFIREGDDVELVFGHTYDVLKWADAAIINSGTASLEATLIGTPQVVCWSTSALTWYAARHLLKVGDHIRFISLANLILDRGIFRELLQDDFNASTLEAEVRRLLPPTSAASASDMDPAAVRARMLSDYADVRAALGGTGASRAVAAAMVARLR